MELTELYTRQLGAMGAPVNEDDVVELDLGDQRLPLHISDMPVMVPTRDKLREQNQSQRVYFHPLAENVLRGESPVLRKLRELATFKLTAVLSELSIQLMELAADTDRHSKLSPKQIELLAAIPNVDAKTVTALEKVISASSVVDDHRLVSIYLKRGGTFNGEKMSRVAVVDFPILTNAEDEEPTMLFGVKMRVKDKTSILALFHAILGEEVDGVYNYGTRSPVAPYYCSLIHAFANVAEALNKIIKRFKKTLDLADLVIDLSWVDHAQDLTPYRDLIPSLPMNEGDVSDAGTGGNTGTAATSGIVAAGTPSPVQQAPSPQQPESWPRYDGQAPVTQQPHYPAQQAPQQDSGNTVSWQSVVSNNQQLQQQIQPQQPQYGYGYGQPPAQGHSPLRERAQAESQRSYYQPTFGGHVPQYGSGRNGW